MQAYARPKKHGLRKACLGVLAAGGWASAAVLVWTACYQPAHAHEASPALKSSARVLAQLDGLEADLGQGNGEISMMSELAERRQHAEQIACHVTDEHLEQISRLDAAVQKKWVEKKKKRTFARARTPRSRTVASR